MLEKLKSWTNDERNRQSFRPLDNENGSIMLIVLLILSLITILGLSSSKTSFIEMQISSNQTIHTDSFYVAEAAIAEGAQSMEDTDLGNNPPPWLVGDPAGAGVLTPASEVADVFNLATWTNNGQVSAALPTAQMMSAYRGLAPGSSVTMNNARIFLYDIYGRGQQNNGLSIVKTSYRKPE